jgi:hypothetical protein
VITTIEKSRGSVTVLSHVEISWDSSVSTVSRLLAWRLEFDSREGSICLFVTTSRPAAEPTQPPVQWVPMFLLRRCSSHGVELTTHLNLVPRLRIRGATAPSPSRVCRGRCLIKHQAKFYIFTENGEGQHDSHNIEESPPDELLRTLTCVWSFVYLKTLNCLCHVAVML